MNLMTSLELRPCHRKLLARLVFAECGPSLVWSRLPVQRLSHFVTPLN